MKKTVMVFKNVRHNYETIVDVGSDSSLLDSYTEDDNYVALSEAVEIDFPELSNDEVVKSEIAIIDRQITKVRADSEAAVTALVGRKQELMALPSADKCEVINK